MRFRDAVVVTLILSAVVSFLILVKVGRNFGWLDLAYAIGWGALLTCAMFPILFIVRRLKGADWHPRLRFAGRFITWWCVLALAYAIPRADNYFLHHQLEHNLLDLLGETIAIALGFAFLEPLFPHTNTSSSDGAEIKAEQK